MAERVRLVLGDFRAMRRGDPGYTSSSQRRMYSPSRDVSISRRQFANQAERIPIPKPPKISHGTSLAKRPRKTRIDKGVSKADRSNIIPLLKDVRKRKGLTQDRESGLSRMQSARQQYEKKTGISPDSSGSTFYDQYDKIRHPHKYDSGEVAAAYDDFFWDDDIGGYIDDFPLGETQ